MTLFFHPFLFDSGVVEESVRLARLDWWVVSDEWRLIRGFQFYVDPVASRWEMTGEEIVSESGDSIARLAVLGHPIEKVLQKFIDDHDVCDKAICMNCEAAFAIMVYEAQKAGMRAKIHIADRRSLKDYTAEVFDLRAGLKPLVEFFIKPGGHGFPEFAPQTTL